MTQRSYWRTRSRSAPKTSVQVAMTWVEPPRHGVGQDHPVDGLLEVPVVVQSRSKAVDRVAHQHEEANVRCDAVQEVRCPGEGGVVGSPLAGDGSGPPREPPGELLDGGGVESLVGHAVEQVALLGEMVRRRDAGVGGNEVVPPRGAGLLGTDAHEVGWAGHLTLRYGRRGEIEFGLPRTEAPEAVEDQTAVGRAQAEEGLGEPGSPHDGSRAGMAAGCHTCARPAQSRRCRVGSVLDGHPATADDQRMPKWISESSTPRRSRGWDSGAPFRRRSTRGLSRGVRDRRRLRPGRVDRCRSSWAPWPRPWPRPWSIGGPTTAACGSTPTPVWPSVTGVWPSSSLGRAGPSPWSRPVAGGWWPTTARSTTIARSGTDWSAPGLGSAAAPTPRCWWRRSSGGESIGRSMPARGCSPPPCGTGRTATFIWCVTASVRSRSTTAGWAACSPSGPS